MSINAKRLGEQIRQARLDANLTQKALAAICKINQAHISRFESGTVRPGLSTLCRLADALGAGWIYDGREIYFIRYAVNNSSASTQAFPSGPS